MLTPDQQHIVDQITSSSGAARIRGRAGTGKTHTFKHLIAELRNKGKNTLSMTPTGAAACRIEDPELKVFAQTIHRALGFQRPQNWADNKWPNLGEFYLRCALSNKKVVQKLKNVDVVLIDECSMLGMRMFNTLHRVFQKARGKDGLFGGVQLIFCGDFLQLPPVKDSWLFESRYFRAINPELHTLSEIVRTDQAEYVDFQNYIRARGVPVFGHEAAKSRRTELKDIPDEALLLVHTNKEVDQHNLAMAYKLFPDTTMKELPCVDQDGERKDVSLCTGMRVMALANHSQLAYANSSVGKIESWDEDEEGRPVAVVEFDDGGTHTVTWKDISYETQSGQKRKFSYYPLKPAYAATINKVQGITADHVAVQCKNRADHGRLFVALTRCRTLEGMHLILPDDAAMAFSDKVSDSEF